jgi:zinc protease
MNRLNRRTLAGGVTLLLLGAAGGLFTLCAAPIAVSDTTLGNGLRVVVYENHASPTTSTQVWYKVGAYYEHSGLTGLSHMLEHMMFQGTKQYGPAQYDNLIEQQGGFENAFTTNNYTVFWADLASDRYELELKLEADRMTNLLLDSTNFERERNVVMEERRLGENRPYDGLWEDFYATAFKTHPYHNPVIGWPDDIRRFHRSDLLRHYQTYYTPSNATLVVAGDVQPHKVFAQAVQYFGGIRAHSVPAWHPLEPPQIGERQFIDKRDVSTPALMIGYHVPSYADSAFYAFEVLQGLLVRGMTSRLYTRLVYQGGKALSVDGGNDVEGDRPGLFYLFAIPRSTVMTDTVEREIYADLESLKTVPVKDSELLQVKNQVIADFIFNQDDEDNMANQIGQSYTMYGSLDFVNNYPDRISGVTKADIMKAAANYFTEDNRTVGRLVPTGNTPPDFTPVERAIR